MSCQKPEIPPKKPQLFTRSISSELLNEDEDDGNEVDELCHEAATDLKEIITDSKTQTSETHHINLLKEDDNKLFHRSTSLEARLKNRHPVPPPFPRPLKTSNAETSQNKSNVETNQNKPLGIKSWNKEIVKSGHENKRRVLKPPMAPPKPRAIKIDTKDCQKNLNMNTDLNTEPAFRKFSSKSSSEPDFSFLSNESQDTTVNNRQSDGELKWKKINNMKIVRPSAPPPLPPEVDVNIILKRGEQIEVQYLHENIVPRENNATGNSFEQDFINSNHQPVVAATKPLFNSKENKSSAPSVCPSDIDRSTKWVPSKGLSLPQDFDSIPRECGYSLVVKNLVNSFDNRQNLSSTSSKVNELPAAPALPPKIKRNTKLFTDIPVEQGAALEDNDLQDTFEAPLLPVKNPKTSKTKNQLSNQTTTTSSALPPLRPKLKKDTVFKGEQVEVQDLDSSYVRRNFDSDLEPSNQQTVSSNVQRQISTNSGLLSNERHTTYEIYEEIDYIEIPSNSLQTSMPNETSQPLPDLINNNIRHLSPKLTYIIRDLQNTEKSYVDHLQQCLNIAQQFKSEGISDATLTKFFGLFQEILNVHNLLLKDLNHQNGTATYVPLCFIKHLADGNMYIRRQWLVPHDSSLDQFEIFLLDRQNLRTYIGMTKDRVKEYIKQLYFFKINCDEEDLECQGVTDKAIKVVEDLYYQLEMVDQFKKIDNVNQKFKECGKVFLNYTFKVSVNGNKRKHSLVYLCENKIIFTLQQKHGPYQYFEDLSTSEIYCTTRKHKSNVFEIGLSDTRGDTKRFIIKADSEAVKNQWCEKLRSILRLEQFQEE